jgi:hypothetical protein
MAHEPKALYWGSYASTDVAGDDFDAVLAAHNAGSLGHVEIGILARAADRTLTRPRHEWLGFHLGHAPSDEFTEIGDELGPGAVALVAVGSEADAATVATLAAHASGSVTRRIEHLGLADGYFASGTTGGGVPDDDTGFEDGSVGHLGV